MMFRKAMLVILFLLNFFCGPVLAIDLDEDLSGAWMLHGKGEDGETRHEMILVSTNLEETGDFKGKFYLATGQDRKKKRDLVGVSLRTRKDGSKHLVFYSQYEAKPSSTSKWSGLGIRSLPFIILDVKDDTIILGGEKDSVIVELARFTKLPWLIRPK